MRLERYFINITIFCILTGCDGGRVTLNDRYYLQPSDKADYSIVDKTGKGVGAYPVFSVFVKGNMIEGLTTGVIEDQESFDYICRWFELNNGNYKSKKINKKFYNDKTHKLITRDFEEIYSEEKISCEFEQ